MDIKKLREELYAAHELRAKLLAYLYQEFSSEVGPEKAAEVMKRAIYRIGQDKGEGLAHYAPDDLAGLLDEFVAGIPDKGRMFDPSRVSMEKESFEVEFSNCPLKNGWVKMGLDEAECAKLCEIARVVDNGTFEGAGFDFTVESLPEGRKESCLLKVSRKKG